MKKGVLLFTLLFSWPLWASHYDAIVSPSPSDGQFRTINQAIASIKPTRSDRPYTILIKNGVYHEKINLTEPNLYLIGEDQDKTVIEYPLAAGMLNDQGNKVGTSGSAIFIVSASNIMVKNLTISNRFDYPANQALSKQDPNRLTDTQAVAVLINGNSDRVRFDKVRIEGFQDTLYLKNNSRSYFTRSVISGHVDFIFGGGTAVINDCELIARARADVSPGEVYGYITAPSTPTKQLFGLIIISSRLSREKGVPANSFALGRPWHPTTTFADGKYADPNAVGMSAFIHNEIDEHIYGWDKMSGKDITGQKIWFYPEDSRFYEFNNYGLGAKHADNRFLISQAQADNYLIEHILSDWPDKFLTNDVE